MDVLITDGLAKEGIEVLTNAGFNAVCEKPENLVEIIRNYDALIVSATKVTRQVIEVGKDRLKIIGRAGSGYDNVDVEAATEHGIVVKIAPYGNTVATAELALALMMSISRNIPQSYNILRNGKWEKNRFGGVDLTGKTLGIVGCGRIGQKLAELVQGFRMDVIGYDPYQQNGIGIRFVDTLEELITKTDYISLHLPAQERPVIGKTELEMMKQTAYLINTSRGGNVDEKALYNALVSGRINGAALDVYETEEKEGQEYHNKLFNLPNFIGTPHLGASTAEAQRKTGIEMAQVVVDYLLKGDFSNAVNIMEEVPVEEQLSYQLFLYHEDIPGIFAEIDRVLADNGINIREIKSSVLKNGKANSVYLLTSIPNQDVVKKIESLDYIRCVSTGF